MSRQINVNLAFTANTEAVKANIQQLSQLLQQISTQTHIGVDGGSLQQAVQSAQQLQIHLQQATNVNTGKIDLSKLSQSLKTAGTDLNSLTSKLVQAGPAGEQAFIKIARAVSQAEAPVVNLGAKLTAFGKTLANTAKWQIASTAIHGVQGAIQGTVSYAKDLNKALTDIQIVTQYSDKTMSDFAETAAKAAKELNTTTTEYTKAALIFYQQGLTGDDVTERADTVVKLAQVTGESSKVVSDQMTAIWNNFADGRTELEYYADVLTKLGASTAASTDEISDGLEKFAAVAGTVGLEYETAAAAVATVVDKTRQSAEVVGTSFKTIFARVQGLQLGETLEDGVDLNKYSEALDKVGISILDADGQLRKMDDILNELGEKWDGFGETTQVALAQTVGGIRQYNQMIALMDNWDDVKKNINLAKDSAGELQAQADIWVNSYEGAAKRVEQRKNELYGNILDDDTLIKMTEGFAGLIDGVTGFIDALGGMGPTIFILAAAFSKTLFPLIQQGIRTASNAFSVWTGKAAQDVRQMQNMVSQEMNKMLQDANISDTTKQQITLSQDLLKIKQKLAIESKNMSVAEREEAERRVQVYEAMVAEVHKGLERKAQIEEELKLLKQQAEMRGSQKRGIATDSAISRSEFSQDDSVKTDALNMKQSNVESEIKSIESSMDKSSVNIINEEYNLKRQIASTQQSINDLENNYVNTSKNNPEREKETLEKIESQKAVLEEQLKKLEELRKKTDGISEEEKERLEHLKNVLKLQQQINAEKKKSTGDLSFGIANTSDSGEDSTADEGKNKYQTTMAANAVSALSGGGVSSEDGTMFSEASLANIEKAGQLMGEYKIIVSELGAVQTDFANNTRILTEAENEQITASSALEEAEKELNAAKNEVNLAKESKDRKAITAALEKEKKAAANVAKAEENLNKAKAKVKKTQDQQIQSFKNSEKAILKAARAAGADEAKIQSLTEAFAKLDKGGTDAKDGIEVIESSLNELKNAAQFTDSQLDVLIDSMSQMLINGGMDPEVVEQFAQKIRQAANEAPNLENGLKKVNKEGEKLGKEGAASAGTFSQKMTTIGSAVGKVAMATGAIKSLIDTLKEGEFSMESFTSVLMSLGMLLPAIGGGIGFVIAAMKAKKIITQEDTKATGQAIVAKMVEMGVLTAETAVIWGNTLANLANLASNPFTWVALAVAIAVIGGLIIGLSNHTKATEQNTQANIENAEKATELTDAWAEQMETMDNLISKLKKLTKGSDEYKQAVQDIIDQVPDMIKAYQELADGLGIDISNQVKELTDAAAAGDVEKIEKIQSELDGLLGEEAYNTAKAGATSQMGVVAQKMEDDGGAGTKYQDKKVTKHVGGVGMKKVKDENGNEMTEEELSVNILEKAGVGKRDGNEGFNIELDANDSGSFVKDYEALKNAATEMRSQLGDKAANSDTLREVQQMLDAAEEEYTKLKELQDKVDKYGVYDAKVKLENEGEDISKISSLEEYEDYKKKLIAASTEGLDGDAAKEAEATAVAWLEAQEGVSDYAKMSQKLSYMESEGVNVTDIRDTIYKDLDEEEQKLFLDVDVNTYQSTEAIKSEIDRLQKEAEKEEIQVKINAASTALDSLKEDGMTEDDLIAIRDSGISWGEDGVINFEDFLNKSYEEQKAYLNELKAKEQNNYNDANRESLTELENSLKNLDTSSDNYQTEKKAIEDNIQAIKDEMAIKEKAAEIEQFENTIEEKGLEKEAINDTSAAYQQYGGVIKGLSKELKNNEKQAKKASIIYNEQKKDITNLQEGWEDIADVLSDSTSSDLEKAEAYNTINESLYSLLGTSKNLSLSQKFISENFGLIQKVLEGDEEALKELKEKSSEEIVLQITGETNIENVDDELKEELNGIKQYAQENGLQYGDILSDEQLAFMQERYKYLAETAGWSAEAIKTYFKNAGYEIDIVDGKINNVSYFDTSKLLLDDKEIKESAEELAKARAEEAKAARDRARSLENEIDYYRTINELIDDLSKEMDKLSKKKDQAYGKNKLAYMDAELKGYEAQIEAQDKLMEQAQTIKDLNQQRLIDMGLGLNFDENNNITNYNEVQAKMAQELANMDENSAEYVLAEERYELFKQYAENYEEAVDTYEDAVIEKTDLEIAKLDAKLESIQYSIDMKIDVNDTELKKLEFLMTQLDDPVADSVEILNNTANSISAHMDNIKTYTNGIKEILKTAGATDSQAQAYLNGDYSAISHLELTGSQVEDITSLSEKAMSEQQSILDGAASIEESVMTVFDGYIEKFDEVASKADSYNSVVDSYKNMIDIVGKDTLGVSDSLIDSMEQASINAASTKIKNAKASLDFVNESLAKAQAERAKYADGTEEAEYWDDQIEILGNKALEKQTELTSEMENGFQKAADRLASALEEAFEKLEDSLAGIFGSLDELMNNFDREQKLADMYLDNGEKLYNISKLNRQIQKDIDNTDNVKAKQELAKLQADINKYSAEGTKMSQKDLEALQKKYDLKLAEIALEEAQNAKSQVRMTRDSEGNWSYTYTADQNQISEAQQKYDDELEANRQLTLETDREITSQIIENRQEMTERMKELRREDYATDEEYYAALEEIANYHIQVEENLIQQARANVDRSRELYMENNLDASNWLIGFNSTMTEMGISYETPSNAATALKEALGNPEEGTGLYGDIVSATNQWGLDINQVMLDAGLSMSNFANATATAMYGPGGSLEKPTGGAIKGINDTKSSITALSTEANNKFGSIAIAVSNWQKKFTPDVKAGTDQVTALYNSLKLLKDNYANTDVKINISIPELDKFNQFNNDLKNMETDKTINITTNYQSNYSSDYDGSISAGNKIVDRKTIGERTYYQTAKGSWYSDLDTGAEFDEDSSGNITAVSENSTAVSYSTDQINLLEKINEKYGMESEWGTNELQIDRDTITVMSSAGKGKSVKYETTGYHPDIYATGKARLIDGKMYLYIKEIQGAMTTVGRGDTRRSYNLVTDEKADGDDGVYVPIDEIQHNGQYLKNTISLDTGGYTGDWGDEGRLAMLHQKEIVLNAYDTENFLRAVEIVREIAGIIDLNAQAASFGLGNINASAVQNHNQTIEQEVTIHAEFPNATNHSEIEEAFNNLINTASQYANRKNR